MLPQNDKRQLMERNSTSAFTLLETAIALFVSTLVIVSSLYAFNRAMSLVMTAQSTNIALSELTSECERLRQEADNNGTIAGLPSVEVIPGDIYTVNVTGNTALNPIPVNVTITWNDDSNRQRNLTINMLLTQRG